MAAHVTLFHNKEAGFEQYSPEQLLKALRKKGFIADYQVVGEQGMKKWLDEPGDAVVIGGGDGTVRKIAKHLIARNIPIGLLPLGTANNVATTLGITGTPEEVIDGWQMTRTKHFDVGIMNGPNGKKFFLESVGFGIFPRLIRQRQRKKANSREKELEYALKHQRQILHDYVPKRCHIQIDARSFSGDYLMVEIMNIQLAGPNMCLAPKADPGDGFLDVVLVRAEERDVLSQFLADCLKGHTGAFPLPVYRTKKLQMEWGNSHYHLDDKAYKAGPPIKASFQLVPQALAFLVSEKAGVLHF